MSKSVTVIKGAVWTQRSITWNRNVFGQLESRGRMLAANAAGVGPDDAGSECGHDDWCVHQGRNFERRTKTL